MESLNQNLQVQQLIEILKDENQGRENKISALEKLKQISPEYFGQLDIEKLSVEKLTGAYDGYVNSLVMAARAKRAEGELIKIDEELQKALEAKTKAQKAYNYMVSVGRATSDEAGALVAANEQVDALQRQFNAIKNVIYQEQVRQGVIKAAPPRDFSDITGLKMESDELRQNSLLYKLSADAVGKATTAKTTFKKVTDGVVESTKSSTKEQKALNDELEKTAVITSGPIANFGQIPTLPTPTGVTSEAPVIPNITALTTQAGNIYQSFSERIGAINTDMQGGILSFGNAFQQTFAAIAESGTGVQQAFFGIADALMQTAEQGSSSLKEFATAAVGAAAKVVRAQIQEAVAGSITTALARSGIPFPFNIAAGAAAGAAASGLFNKLLSSIKVPGFARGTKYAPGGLALVGEQGPELMNVPRGSQILSNNRTNRSTEGTG